MVSLTKRSEKTQPSWAASNADHIVDVLRRELRRGCGIGSSVRIRIARLAGATAANKARTGHQSSAGRHCGSAAANAGCQWLMRHKSVSGSCIKLAFPSHIA